MTAPRAVPARHDGGMDTAHLTTDGTATTTAGLGAYASLPLQAARRLIHVRRAFGEPVERDGLTLVPVARVWGGTGFGGGDGTIDEAGEPARSGSGGGGGLGVGVTPVGVYVVKGGEVRWEPAFDLNRAIIGGQVLGAIAILALARALRRRRR